MLVLLMKGHDMSLNGLRSLTCISGAGYDLLQFVE